MALHLYYLGKLRRRVRREERNVRSAARSDDAHARRIAPAARCGPPRAQPRGAGRDVRERERRCVRRVQVRAAVIAAAVVGGGGCAVAVVRTDRSHERAEARVTAREAVVVEADGEVDRERRNRRRKHGEANVAVGVQQLRATRTEPRGGERDDALRQRDAHRVRTHVSRVELDRPTLDGQHVRPEVEHDSVGLLGLAPRAHARPRRLLGLEAPLGEVAHRRVVCAVAHFVAAAAAAEVIVEAVVVVDVRAARRVGLAAERRAGADGDATRILDARLARARAAPPRDDAYIGQDYAARHARRRTARARRVVRLPHREHVSAPPRVRRAAAPQVDGDAQRRRVRRAIGGHKLEVAIAQLERELARRRELKLGVDVVVHAQHVRQRREA